MRTPIPANSQRAAIRDIAEDLVIASALRCVELKCDSTIDQICTFVQENMIQLFLNWGELLDTLETDDDSDETMSDHTRELLKELPIALHKYRQDRDPSFSNLIDVACQEVHNAIKSANSPTNRVNAAKKFDKLIELIGPAIKHYNEIKKEEKEDDEEDDDDEPRIVY